MADGTDTAVTFDIDYPDHKLERLSSFFRLILALPILIVLGILANIVSVLTAG